MTSPVIELARLADAAAIAQMSRRLVEYGLPWVWTPQRVARQMKHRETLVAVAREPRVLAGFAIMQFGRERAHLVLLAVETSRQRQGIGRRLMTWLEETAVVAGTFIIGLEVRAGNAGAVRFYRSLGYAETGRRRHYYCGMEDAIRMSRDLRVRDCESAG